MKNSESNKRTSLSFLQRFEGKKSTISKEGLVHLFQQHQKKILSLPLGGTADVRKMNLDSSNKELLTERVSDIQRLGSDLRGLKKDPTSRMSHRTDILKNEQNPKDDLVLPRIGNRFSSSHQKLLPKQDEGKKLYLNLQRPQKKILPLGKNMDENAIQHLQFLNKLEETLAGLRNKSDRR